MTVVLGTGREIPCLWDLLRSSSPTLISNHALSPTWVEFPELGNWETGSHFLRQQTHFSISYDCPRMNWLFSPSYPYTSCFFSVISEIFHCSSLFSHNSIFPILECNPLEQRIVMFVFAFSGPPYGYLSECRSGTFSEWSSRPAVSLGL